MKMCLCGAVYLGHNNWLKITLSFILILLKTFLVYLTSFFAASKSLSSSLALLTLSLTEDIMLLSTGKDGNSSAKN